MKKLYYILLILTLFLVSISSAEFEFGNCGTTQVCGVVPASSESGYGIVEFCGQCYPCGVADGVCPEDFTNGTTQGSCKKCPDPDCTVNITGHLKIAGRPNAEGVPADIDIYAYYESAPNTGVHISTSEINGYYEAQVPSGDVTLLVKDTYWDSEPKELDLIRGQVYNNIDITIIEGICNEDCTGAFGSVCKSACQGINGCDYFPVSPYSSAELANLCDYVPIGNKVFLYETDSFVYDYVCCSQGISKTPKVKIELLELNNIENLRSTKIPIILDGQVRYLVFNVWSTD